MTISYNRVHPFFLVNSTDDNFERPELTVDYKERLQISGMTLKYGHQLGGSLEKPAVTNDANLSVSSWMSLF